MAKVAAIPMEHYYGRPTGDELMGFNTRKRINFTGLTSSSDIFLGIGIDRVFGSRFRV